MNQSTKTPVIAIWNYDGGAGKTTTTYNLAVNLKRLGVNVICIDLDPKGGFTSKTKVEITNNGIADVMMGRNTPLIAAQNGEGDIVVIGTDVRLSETAAAIQAKSPNHHYLSRAIGKLGTAFDVVLIDCPPSADVLITNMAFASDYIIIPVELNEDSKSDASRVVEMVAEAEEVFGKAPKILGIVFTKVNAQTVAYRKAKAEVETLGLPILAEIAKREGVTAGEMILNGYMSVAEMVQAVIVGGKNA